MGTVLRQLAALLFDRKTHMLPEDNIETMGAEIED
jgi:hypothetical protein